MTSTPPPAVSTEVSSPHVKGGARAKVRPVVVTGVLVVHDGAAWLTECLDALALQTRPPDRLVIVDTGSIDGSQQIAATHAAIRRVIDSVDTVSLPRECTFGEAVGCAVRHHSPGWQPSRNSVSSDPKSRDPRSRDPRSADWLWLLHDDSTAAPEALAHLLDAARRSRSVGIAGPKLMTWDDPSRLLEVGSVITRTGSRAGGPVTGEPDQGQHDHRTDVLGVNSSGMLIRRDVFDELGGFDPAFGQFRGDLDICWRAHLAGHRVVIVPKARIREAAASINGQRSPDLRAEDARRLDRSHGHQVALARSSPYAVPLLMLWILAARLASAAVLLVVRRPRRAWVELGGLAPLMTPWRPWAARWRSRGICRVRRRDLRGLFVSPLASFRHRLGTVRDAAVFTSPRQADDRAAGAPCPEQGALVENGETFDREGVGAGTRTMRYPGLLAVLVACLLAAAAWRPLFGALIARSAPVIAGAELLPVSGDASELWHTWLDGWHGPGLGTSVESAPYLPVLSAGAWLLEKLPLIDASTSSVGLLTVVVLVAAIPLSACTAYLGARVLTRAPWPRAWAALAWASLPTLTTAVASGRLGAVVTHILFPLIAAGFVRVARRSVSSPATFGTAGALGLAGSFNPAFAACGALAALVLIILGPGVTRLRAAVLLLVPVGLMGPWLLRLVDNPVLLLSGPGLTLWQDTAAAPWQLALMHPGGPGSYPTVMSAPILLAGVVAMSARGVGSRAMSVLALLTVTGLALGMAAPHIVIGRIPPGRPGAGGPITMWAGTWLDLAALALVSAAVLGARELSGRRSLSGFGWRRALAALVAAGALLGVGASVVAAGWLGVGEALTGVVPSAPAVATDQADGPMGSRLLVLTRDANTIGYQLTGSEPGPVVRDLPGAPTAPDPGLAAAVKIAVSDADTAPAGAAQDALAGQGIGFVAFRGQSGEPLVLRLDATAGLTRLSDNQGLILWRVLPRDDAVGSSRLRLVDATGAALASVPVTGGHGHTDASIGPADQNGSTVGRRLVVAEPPGWADHARVSYAGRELAAVTGGEQPTYLLPPDAGQLSISIAPSQQWWRWGQLGLLLVVLFLAAPLRSTRVRTGA